MEKVGQCPTSRCRASHVLKTCGGEVCEENLCTPGGLTTNFLGNVADCEVDWICGLVPEKSKLCLI